MNRQAIVSFSRSYWFALAYGLLTLFFGLTTGTSMFLLPDTPIFAIVVTPVLNTIILAGIADILRRTSPAVSQTTFEDYADA